MSAKKPKYVRDQKLATGEYVRAWKQGREIVVQVWRAGAPEGEPNGDWEMPGMLGVEAAVAQAVLQTGGG